MSEHDEAVVLCQWMDAKGIRYAHIPNEGKRSFAAARRLKAEGLQPGFPDYVILSRPRNAPGSFIGPLFIELKSRRGCLSENQLQWHQTLRSLGYLVHVCHGADAAISVLLETGY